MRSYPLCQLLRCKLVQHTSCKRWTTPILQMYGRTSKINCLVCLFACSPCMGAIQNSNDILPFHVHRPDFCVLVACELCLFRKSAL